MKNNKLILEIFGIIVAFFVVVIMIWDHFSFKESMKMMAEQNRLAQESIKKMADQNKLSEESIARMDSTLFEMRTSNELYKKSLEIEIQKYQEEIKLSEISFLELKQKNRPLITINPFIIMLEKYEFQGDIFMRLFLCFYIRNEGLADADSVHLRCGPTDTLIGFIESNREKYFELSLNCSYGNAYPELFPYSIGGLLLYLSYIWKIPYGENIIYQETKIYGFSEPDNKKQQVEIYDVLTGTSSTLNILPRPKH